MQRSRLRFPGLISVLLLLMIWAACSKHGPTVPDEGMAALRLVASVAGTDVTVLVVEVTADDFPNPLLFNIAVEGGMAEGILDIPAGSDRRILVDAFNQDGIETHEGETTIDVIAGTNPTVRITLLPLAGSVPIEVTVGSVIVTVEPSTTVLLRGEQLQLTASAEDSDGNPRTGDIGWATSNPFVASVDGTGQVTAAAAGEALIAAHLGAASGIAEITVLMASVDLPVLLDDPLTAALVAGLGGTAATDVQQAFDDARQGITDDDGDAIAAGLAAAQAAVTGVTGANAPIAGVLGLIIRRAQAIHASGPGTAGARHSTPPTINQPTADPR